MGCNEEEMKSKERLCKSEKISEGSAVRELLFNKSVKEVKKEEMTMEWKGKRGQ